METRNTIAVIGGGAAGMFAAVIAAERGAGVTLYEKNDKFGRKLGITGKGRCNLTNDCSVQEFIAHVNRNEKFLLSAANRFSPEDTIAYFSKYTRLKTERGNRVFPVSDRAADIVNVLRNRCSENGVDMVRSAEIKSIRKTDGGYIISYGSRSVFHPIVMICTGGMSYPLTGSTGDGYRFAEELGHTVTPLSPALIGIDTELLPDHPVGLTLRNVRLTLTDCKGKQTVSDVGELLFTHTGVSGPLVLTASSKMKLYPTESYSMSVDIKPGIPEDELDRKLIRLLAEGHGKSVKNALSSVLPSSFLGCTIKVAGIDGDKKAAEVTKEERKSYLQTLKAFPLKPTGTRPFDEAIITAGGVSVKEISAKTMESKISEGLYFAGEIIDVDACTGGYNLQTAFCTAYAAATDAAEKLSYIT